MPPARLPACPGAKREMWHYCNVAAAAAAAAAWRRNKTRLALLTACFFCPDPSVLEECNAIGRVTMIGEK